jgi:hypothetical protein
MNSVIVLEWKFSPADYFEGPTEVKLDYTTIKIDDGKAEAEIDSAIYDPSIRSTLQDALNSRFLGFQLSSRNVYNLSSPTMTRMEHADGRKDYIMEVESMHIEATFHPVTLLKCDKDGNVIADGQTEKMKSLVDLVSKHYKDEVLKSLLRSHKASVDDPDNELVHLYEIRDALFRKFGRKSESTLNISHDDWSDFGLLCNNESLRQGRHRGESCGPLRNATDAELSEARRIAQAMIEGYLQYLDINAPK